MGAAVFFVEGDVEQGAVATGEESDDRRAEEGGEQDLVAGDGEDAAEKVGHEVRGVAGGEVDEEDAERHACRPEDADKGVLTQFPVAPEVLDAECRQEGEEGGAAHGRDAGVVCQSQAAEGGVGDAAADEYHAAGDDVGAHQPAGDTGEKGGEEGVLEEVVV